MENNRFFPEAHGNFGFGCMRLPLIGEEVDLEQFSAMVDRFLEQGFNTVGGEVLFFGSYIQ